MPGDATEIFQEGLIIPPVKLFDRDEERGDIWRMLLANIRTPRSSYGDISAMCGSLLTAERLFGEQIERHGIDTLLAYIQELKNHGERRLRHEISRLPQGIYSGECLIDDDGVTTDAFLVKATVAVREDTIIVDYRGSDRQARGPVNAVYSVAYAAALNSVLQTLGADVQINQGLHRPIKLIAPPGTVVNVDFPGSVNSGNTESHNILAEAILGGLRQAAPDLVCAPSASTTCLLTGGAWNPETREPYTLVTWEVAGWGAFKNADGVNAMGRYASMIVRNIPVEVHETQFPWRVKYWQLRVGSGGAGTYRGGLGGMREYELHAPEFTFGVNSNRGKYAPQGIDGGRPSLPTRWWIRREGTLLDPLSLDQGLISPDKFNGMRIFEGEAIVSECPGGGGWGPPNQRDKDRVREDLKQGYIPLEEAVNVYELDRAEAEAIVERYHWKGH
jgi:N-methylhydantoinase B/oxoprolinase/acetone carboxylase alpha subunit